MTLKRLLTLSRQKDFDFIFKKGRRQEGRMFKIWYLENKTEENRFAFVVPKSVDKRATVRNKIRRRTKEWIRNNQNTIEKEGLDILFFFKKESAICPKDEFYEELSKVSRKILN